MCILSKNPFVIKIFLLAVFLYGFTYSLYIKNVFLFYDEWDYVRIAKNIAYHGFYSADGVNPSSFRPPGYPLFLALPLWMGFNLILIRILNFIFLCFSIRIVSMMLRRYSDLAALLGVILFCCYPVLFYTAGTFYPQTIATTLNLLTIYLFFYTEDLTPLRIFTIGCLCGFLILMIPTFTINVALMLAWIFFKKYSHRITTCLCLVLSVALVILPWTFRNYMTFHAFIPISTNGGINFLLGNSKDTQPNSGVNVDISNFNKNRFVSELEADKYYQHEAWSYIKENKLHSIKLYFLKLLNYFNYWNILSTESEVSSSREYVMMFSYAFLLNVALLRLFFYKTFPLEPWETFSYLLYFLNGVVLAFVFTRIRFRIPYDPLLIMINARFLAHYLQEYFQKRESWKKHH